MKSIQSKTSLLLVCTAILLGLPCPPVFAQAANGDTFETTYVPATAIVVAIFSPDQLLEAKALELMPIEILRVAGQEQFGVDPMELSEVRLVVSSNPQTMQPQLGAMIRGGVVDLEDRKSTR